MNIRYPIYEGVYRILTIHHGRCGMRRAQIPYPDIPHTGKRMDRRLGTGTPHRGRRLFQPLPSRAVPGRTGRGGRLQHHPQEKPAALPLYGCGTGRIHGQERTGNGSHTSQHHPHLARTQIYPLFGEIRHSDSQGTLFLRNGTGHENSRRLPHLGLGSGTGADRAGRTDTGGISGRCTGTGEGDYR